MTKNYTKPELQVITVCSEGIMAGSGYSDTSGRAGGEDLSFSDFDGFSG